MSVVDDRVSQFLADLDRVWPSGGTARCCSAPQLGDSTFPGGRTSTCC